jgi:hypothetical protein
MKNYVFSKEQNPNDWIQGIATELVVAERQSSELIYFCFCAYYNIKTEKSLYIYIYIYIYIYCEDN